MDHWIIIVIGCTVLGEVLTPALRWAQRKIRYKKLRNLSNVDLIKYIDDLVGREATKQNMVGIAIGIIKNDCVILAKGYGYAELEQSIPVTNQTVFKIASVSKHMVAVCVMRLAEEAKLNVTDSLLIYFPDAPSSWNEITIHHLLNLSSGLRRESPIFKWTERQSFDELIRSIYSVEPAFLPGSKWQYNNMSYVILAKIIEKVTGESFENYTNHFFSEIGLKNTTTTSCSDGPFKAAGYRFFKQGKSFNKMDFVALRPSGAFSSSISDLLK